MIDKNKSLREKNKYKKINSMLKAALRLFLEKGFDNTSIEEITKKSNVAKGTFYLYFKDKIDIRNKIIVEKSSEIVNKAYAYIKNKTYANREDQIIDFCDYIINYLIGHKDMLKLIHKNISTSLYREVLEEEYEENNIKKAIGELQDQFKDTYTEEEFMINLFIILEMVGSVLYSSIIHKEPADIEVIKPYLYNNIRKIVRS
ncbi:MAG: TetR/AcrR family transcriptional regulator [Peptoniphilaceae bacterium]|nr:TetR/AcrR family transcriptional regulator [Peptoniphilaceae bacterium]MDY6018125.1 TetR/AcrR family transcriptional regulator [Anaerococcus sp.]